MTLTLDWRIFAALADSMAPVTSKDSSLPVLSAVRLTWDGAACTATATDRYQMAQLTVPADSGGEPGKALVMGNDLVRLRRMWKPARGLDWQVTLYGGTWGCPRGTWSAEPVEGKFPNVDSVWPTPDREKGGQPHLRPRLVSSLMRSAQAAGAYVVRVETAAEPNKAILFTVRDLPDGWSWRGLLMPVRKEAVDG